jgi:hypothetical protein
VPEGTREGPWWLRSQAGAFARTLATSALAPALPRALPAWVVLLALSENLGPGSAADGFTTLADRRSLLVALVVAWLFGTAPARAHLLGSRRLGYLRTLPLPRWQVAIAVIALVAILDAPWIGLCVQARDAGVALAGPALSLAGQLLVGAGRWWTWAAFAALAGAALVAPLVPVGIAALAAGLAAWAPAWTRARHDLPWSPLRRAWRSPALALASAALASLPRHQPGWPRGALVGWAGAVGVAVLAVRNNAGFGTEDLVRATLIAATLFTCVALARMAAHVVEADAQLAWLVATTGAPARARVVGARLAAAAVGALLVGGQALTVSALLAPPAAPALAALGLGWGALFGLAALGVAGRAARGGAVDQPRLFGGILAVVVLGDMALVAHVGLGAAVMIALAAAGAVASRTLVMEAG